MPNFTTRVELHAAKEQDYEALHAAMEAEGFTRTIVSSEGIRYQLPTAEYSRTDETNRDKVLESAKRAAEVTQRRFSILVTESDGRTWWNLKKAD